MGKGLAITGLVLSILTLLLTVYIKFILFTFNDLIWNSLFYLTFLLGITNLIINLIVLIKKKVEGKILSWIGIVILILAVLIAENFRQIS